MRVSRVEPGLTRARIVAIAFATALVVAACGKTASVAPVAGVYHLTGSEEPTNLELRPDGTFTLRRDSCESAGGLECGAWKTEVTGASQVVAREGLYWPTPDAFPSAVVRTLALRRHGHELEVVGESEWAGSFKQRWAPGRTCRVCGGLFTSGARSPANAERPCDAPLPACSPPR
ncbi:hypothetical protein BH11MYX4_BH11MYX4_65760 [soil metagenome]